MATGVAGWIAGSSCRRIRFWNRPLWSDDYDKRFCFDAQSVRSRIAYVERHNLAIGLPAKPWPEIEEPDYSDM